MHHVRAAGRYMLVCSSTRCMHESLVKQMLQFGKQPRVFFIDFVFKTSLTRAAIKMELAKANKTVL